MKNGTSQAVLVGELISGDGPHLPLADDFIAQRCSNCAVPGGDDLQFVQLAYLCADCAGLAHR